MVWNGQLYVDTSLLFRLRSAPKGFTAVADALLFILQKKGAHQILHYLDDFLLFGAPGTSQCGKALKLVLEWCTRLGVPIAKGKTEGPAECINFLGVQIDTLKGAVSTRRETALLAERNRTVDREKVMQEKRFVITN